MCERRCTEGELKQEPLLIHNQWWSRVLLLSRQGEYYSSPTWKKARLIPPARSLAHFLPWLHELAVET